MTVLLADIGGTNARLAWLKSGKISKVVKFECKDFKKPYDLIDAFLKKEKEKLTEISFSVAGPVHKGYVQWTNRKDWILSETQLKKKYKIKKALLLNDMVAQGYALKPDKNKNGILMNIGTGLGCCLFLGGKVYPAEFGQTLDDNNYRKEDYLSGKGLVRIYHEMGGDKKIHSAKKLDEMRMVNKDKKAIQTYRQFYKLWGKTAANISVAHLINVVFLWGGLVPKNEKDMKDFLSEFYNKKYPTFHQKVPVKIVREENLALKGLVLLSNHKSVEP